MDNKIIICDDFIPDKIVDYILYIIANNIYNIFVLTSKYDDIVKYIYNNRHLINWKITFIYYLFTIDTNNILYYNIFDIIRFKNESIKNEFIQVSINNLSKYELIRVITFGTYDLYHYGHFNIINRCKKFADTIIVGISSDNFNKIKEKVLEIETEIKNITEIKNKEEEELKEWESEIQSIKARMNAIDNSLFSKIG